MSDVHNNLHNHDEAKQAWQDQPLEATTMSVQEVRARIEKLSKLVRRRNIIGGFACTTVFLAFIYFSAGSVNRLERIGSILTAVGGAYVGLQILRRKMGAREIDSSRSQTETSITFYRSELQRQRDFHRGIWLWSRLLIFVPGPVVFLIGLADADPHRVTFIAIEAAVFILLLAWSVPKNLRLARNFQRELDALDSQLRT